MTNSVLEKLIVNIDKDTGKIMVLASSKSGLDREKVLLNNFIRYCKENGISIIFDDKHTKGALKLE